MNRFLKSPPVASLLISLGAIFTNPYGALGLIHFELH